MVMGACGNAPVSSLTPGNVHRFVMQDGICLREEVGEGIRAGWCALLIAIICMLLQLNRALETAKTSTIKNIVFVFRACEIKKISMDSHQRYFICWKINHCWRQLPLVFYIFQKIKLNQVFFSSKATAELITPQCQSQSVAQFLWQHLQRDLDVLGRALGRSVDDAALTVHLVLQRMISLNGGQTGNLFT